MTNKSQRKSFYVVQFIELPFKDIDDYVCVPYSWLILRRSSGRKTAVTYPNDEDPFDTRDRVKKREKPNNEWRFYMAFIIYNSENYKDVEYWIASRNDYAARENKPEITDIQSEPELNRKLRSADQPFWSGAHSDKFQLTVKPCNNSRKPLPRISIKRPLTQKPAKDLDNKPSELYKKVKLGTVTDHAIEASGVSKQKPSIVMTDQQLMEYDQMKTGPTSNGLTSTKQSSQPEVIKENRSDQINFTSTNLLAEQQLSSQPPNEQQSPPKLKVEQQPSPKLSTEQQILPVEQDFQQSLTTLVTDLDESDGAIESTENVIPYPIPKKRLLSRTPPNTLEQIPQPEPLSEISTPLVGYEPLLSEPHLQDLSIEKSKEPNGSQKTYPRRFLTTPTIVPTPSSTYNQPFQQIGHHQSSILSISSSLNSKPETQKIVGRNSTEAAHNYQRPRSQELMNSIPSTSHNAFNLIKLSPLLTPVHKRQSSAVKNSKNPVEKKTRLESITKNMSTMIYSPNQKQFCLPSDVAIIQSALPDQNQLQQQVQVNGSLVNNMRRYTEEKYMNQKVSNFQGLMNTPASQTLFTLAHQYPSVGPSRDQQYLPQEECLRQFACIQDTLGRRTMVQTIDQRVHNRNSMTGGGFVPPSLPNPINHPLQFFPQNGNQYIPVNSASAQGVIRHEQMRKPVYGIQPTYKPNVDNGVNIDLTAHNSSNQSHQNSEHSQRKQGPPNYQDPCTASTQNVLSLKLKRRPAIPDLQRVFKRLRSLSTSETPSQELLDLQESIFFQELNLQKRVEGSTDFKSMNLAAVPKNVTVEPASPPQDSEAQTTPLTDQPYETQSTSVQSNYVYQHPHMKKTVVDQATETDSIMNLNHFVEETTQSLVTPGAPKVMDSACQTDEWLREGLGSTNQESASDPETGSEQEIDSENEVASEDNHIDLTNIKNVTREDQQVQARIVVEQDMLNKFSTLFTQMGANLAYTRDTFNFLRNSMLVCGETYKKILEKVGKFNEIALFQNPTSPSGNVTSQVLQVTQGKLAGDNDNITGVGKLKRRPAIPDLQRVFKRLRSLSTSETPSQELLDLQESIFFQELNLQKRVEGSTDFKSMNLAAVPKNVTVEPAPPPQDSEAQTTPLTDQPYETQSTSVQSNYVYQHPHMKKTVVDQATETDSIMNLNHFVEETTQSLVTPGAPKVMDSACQTDEWLREGLGSTNQESASDPETGSEQEIDSENEVASEDNHIDLTNIKNVTREDQQVQARIVVEQDMLNKFSTLFTQMGANLAYTRDTFNFLRNSMLVCGETYKKILEKVGKFNEIALFQNPTSPSGNVTSQVLQVTQGKLAGDNDNITGVGNAPICTQRGTFSLPEEYDSNDTTWTRKYREKKPGLVELLPKTGVYVKKNGLKRCILESNDCKTLARMLLTEVFSNNALSVCSLTGGKAKAFKSVNIDVRPGLDEHARMVLLVFIAEHEKKRGWITTNTRDVVNSIRTKINEIRAKHRQKCKVLK